MEHYNTKIYIKDDSLSELFQAATDAPNKQLLMASLAENILKLKLKPKPVFRHEVYDCIQFRLDELTHKKIKALSKKYNYSIPELFLMAFNQNK